MTASHLCVCVCWVHTCACHCVSVDVHINTQFHQTHTKCLKQALWLFTVTVSFHIQSTSDTHLLFSYLHLSSLALYPSFVTSCASPLLWGNPELSPPGVGLWFLPSPCSKQSSHNLLFSEPGEGSRQEYLGLLIIKQASSWSSCGF